MRLKKETISSKYKYLKKEILKDIHVYSKLIAFGIISSSLSWEINHGGLGYIIYKKFDRKQEISISHEDILKELKDADHFYDTLMVYKKYDLPPKLLLNLEEK